MVKWRRGIALAVTPQASFVCFGTAQSAMPHNGEATGKSRVASAEADGTNVFFFCLSLRPRSIYSLSGNYSLSEGRV